MILLIEYYGILYKPPKWPVLYDKCIGKSIVICNLIEFVERKTFVRTFVTRAAATWYTSPYTSGFMHIDWKFRISKY